MKALFMSMLFALVMATLATMYMTQRKESDIPVIYWVTDNNPARALQVENFRKWLAKRGFPDAELQVDTSNGDLSKKIIQGVSGVAGDVVDCGTGGGDMQYMVETGIVEDVTDAGVKLGFSPSMTYPSLKDDICIDGSQYVFPCNVSVNMLIVNLDTFRRLGLEDPPMRMDFEEFERRGREYMEAANKGLSRKENFFCYGLSNLCVARSLGGDLFNETLTGGAVDSVAFVKMLALIYKWTYVDHIMPSSSDMASFATQSGYGGAGLQLFNSGNFAMIQYGRYALIQLRQFGKINLDAVEFPNGGYPNSIIYSRSAFVYKGGVHRDIAKRFLAYLASEDYNRNIVEDSDSLPPNPEYTRIDAYLRPKGLENEWALHRKLAVDAVDISIVQSKSPYLSNKLAYNFLEDGFASVMSGILSPEAAAKDIQARIDREIDRTVRENPRLAASYEKDREMQRRIDAIKASGGKIPLEWIKNPFHRKYCKEKGLAE
jgi:multiple sugar transport system substrate-binding protein